VPADRPAFAGRSMEPEVDTNHVSRIRALSGKKKRLTNSRLPVEQSRLRASRGSLGCTRTMPRKRPREAPHPAADSRPSGPRSSRQPQGERMDIEIGSTDQDSMPREQRCVGCGVCICFARARAVCAYERWLSVCACVTAVPRVPGTRGIRLHRHSPSRVDLTPGSSTQDWGHA
jgi:hypothetical protein